MPGKAFSAEGSAAWKETVQKARGVSTFESLEDMAKQSLLRAGSDPPLVGDWTKDIQSSHSQHF